MDRDDRLKELVDDFRSGYVTRRGFLAKAGALGLTAAAAIGLLGLPRAGEGSAARSPSPTVRPKKWKRGEGWGWVWGEDDQVGSLNELSPELTKKALSLVREGKVYDLGLTYERRSYRFAGHNPGEIISFRTPAGEFVQQDLDFVVSEKDNSLNTTFTSNALFISDNVSTQLDALGHIYEGGSPARL